MPKRVEPYRSPSEEVASALLKLGHDLGIARKRRGISHLGLATDVMGI